MSLARLPPAGTVPPERTRIKEKRALHPCPFGTAEDALDQHIARLGLPLPDERFVVVEEKISADDAIEAIRWGRTLASKNRKQEFRAPYKTMDPEYASMDLQLETPRGRLPYDEATLRASYEETRDIYHENMMLAAAMRNPITHQLHDAQGNPIDAMPYEKEAPRRPLPSTADIEKEDVERARRYRLAYERDHRGEHRFDSAAVDGNLTPFPINRYFPMPPPVPEYAPDHKY